MPILAQVVLRSVFEIFLLMMPFDTAVAYAQFCLRMALTYGNSSVHWLRQRDEATRSRMASGIRRGFPACEALERALEETHQDWRSRSMNSLPEDVPLQDARAAALADSPGGGRPKRIREGGRGDDERRAAKETSPKKRAKPASSSGGSQSVPTVSMIRGGLKLCKPYNDNRGCNNRSCKDVHECDVRMEGGRHCGSKEHTRLNHS